MSAANNISHITAPVVPLITDQEKKFLDSLAAVIVKDIFKKPTDGQPAHEPKKNHLTLVRTK